MNKTPTVYIAMSADLIHPGHINIMKLAREYADKINGKVVLGLLTDSAIASYKRLPYMNYEQRKIIVESMEFIDEVIPQNTLSYAENITKLKPRFVIHGDDWKDGPQKNERSNVIALLKELNCGELIEPKYTEGISSTALNQNARSLGITTNTRLSLLRRLIDAKKPLRILETHSAISALIAENTFVTKDGVKVEFDGFWSSSLADSTIRGKPDIEAVELSSRLNTLNEIFEVTTKPLIYDADTGGKLEHFVFTVRSLERIGVSAVIIEDKIGLKKNSLLGNDVVQNQDNIEDFCAKIQAGKKAQITNDFMIIARIESLILDKGMDDALQRAFAYIKAGADGIMIHSRHKDANEIIEFLKIFRSKDQETPIVVVPTSFCGIKADDLAKYGVNIVVYANHMIRSSFVAMQSIAKEILENDRSEESEKKCMKIDEILNLIPGTV
ncbi:phosphoenolpyruvate mutase [Campylobacter sp. W0018]|uniref:phosphoenolpyruvate mutase n=1 Tax=Campylobacter sp. W0018 TaxID=2735782 RepID=UPI00301BB20B